MPVDWTLNRDPIGNILSKMKAAQDMRGESQRQRGEDQRQQMVKNQDLEGTSKFGVEQGYVVPKYDEQGNFQGYGRNEEAYASDLPMMKKDLPQLFPKPPAPAPAPSPSVAQPSLDDDPLYAQARARNRALGVDPAQGQPPAPGAQGDQGAQQPPAAVPPPGHAESIRAAASPQQMPGDPKPILTDPKVNHEIAKIAAQAPPGVTFAPNAPVQGSGLDMTAEQAPEPKPNADHPSPFLMNRIGGYMTTMPHYQVDPEIPLSNSGVPEAELKAMGYTDDQIAHGTSRRSILQEQIKGNFSLRRAEMMAKAGGLPDITTPYIAHALDSGDGAEAMQAFQQDHPGTLTPKQNQALENAILRSTGQFNSKFNANRNYGLRAENQNENQAGKGAQAVDNNPIARQYQQRIDGGGRALDLIHKMRLAPNDPNYVMPSKQTLHQLMNEIGRLETGSGSVAESNLEAGAISNKQAELTSIYNNWTGDDVPADIGRQLIQAEQLINSLRHDYAQNRAQVIKGIGAGRGPKQRAAIDAKAKEAEGAQKEVQGQTTYQSELALAQQKLAEYQKREQAGTLPPGAEPYTSRRRRVEQLLQQNYGKGLP